MSPQEIAEANNQAPPQEFHELPTHPMFFNASEIVAQCKRESCLCQHDPLPCLACQGTRRVTFLDSEADDSFPEITRHEFRTRFPDVKEPKWPVDEGVYVPDDELVWWTPYDE